VLGTRGLLLEVALTHPWLFNVPEVSGFTIN
jgi:hypothetical protein